MVVQADDERPPRTEAARRRSGGRGTVYVAPDRSTVPPGRRRGSAGAPGHLLFLHVLPAVAPTTRPSSAAWVAGASLVQPAYQGSALIRREQPWNYWDKMAKTATPLALSLLQRQAISVQSPGNGSRWPCTPPPAPCYAPGASNRQGPASGIHFLDPPPPSTCASTRPAGGSQGAPVAKASR